MYYPSNSWSGARAHGALWNHLRVSAAAAKPRSARVCVRQFSVWDVSQAGRYSAAGYTQQVTAAITRPATYHRRSEVSA